MHDTNLFLANLTLVLAVAGLTSFIFHKFRQPVVLGYILAGMIVGPYTPIPLFADSDTIHAISELGVVLLMFSLGLEFSLRRLFKVLPTAGLIALIQCSFLIWLGYAVGRTLGWTSIESFYAGAIIAISSTTIIVKAFSELGVKGKVTEIVFGVLIVEDLIAVMLLAGLPIFMQQEGNSLWVVAKEAGALFMFLATLGVLGVALVPRMMRSIMRVNRSEMTLVVSIGLCFAISLLAKSAGYSVALGAFMIGSLMAESGEEVYLETLIRPVRDMFAAIFFVSVGMLINPTSIVDHWFSILIFTLCVIFGKFLGVMIGSFLSGYGTRLSVKSAMSLSQIGEFSFIIAGVGIASGAVRDFLYPLAVAVSVITTLTTPWFIRRSDSFAIWFERILPHRVQTLATFYEEWIQRLRTQDSKTKSVQIRRLVTFLFIDFVLLTIIIIGSLLSMDHLVMSITGWVDIPQSWARIGGVGVMLLFASPFAFGIFRLVRSLGLELVTLVLPKNKDSKMHLAHTTKRTLVVTFQLGLMLLMGMPLLALTQPFIPPYYGMILLVILVFILGIAFWKGATDFYGHIHAGAEMVVEMMNKTIDKQREIPVFQLEQYLPGLGSVFSIRLNHNSSAIGQTLSELNLRALTGASVLAITRGSQGIVVPTGSEQLQRNDVIAITGTDEAISAAKKMLEGK